MYITSVTIDGVRYTNQLRTRQTTNPDSRNLNLGIPSVSYRSIFYYCIIYQLKLIIQYLYLYICIFMLQTVQNNTPSISLLRKNLEHHTTKSNNESTSEIEIGSLLPFQASRYNEVNNICKLPSFTNSFKTASSKLYFLLISLIYI